MSSPPDRPTSIRSATAGVRRSPSTCSTPLLADGWARSWPASSDGSRRKPSVKTCAGSNSSSKLVKSRARRPTTQVRGCVHEGCVLLREGRHPRRIRSRSLDSQSSRRDREDHGDSHLWLGPPYL